MELLLRAAGVVKELGGVDCVRFKKGKKDESKNEDKRSILMMTSQQGFLPIVKLLVEHGAYAYACTYAYAYTYACTYTPCGAWYGLRS